MTSQTQTHTKKQRVLHAMLQSQLECALCGAVNPCRFLLCFRAKKALSISKCGHCTGVQLMQRQQLWPIQFYPPDISQKMFSYGIIQCSWQHINGEIVQHVVTYSVSCWTQSLSSSTWPPMNQTRFEKYGAAVLSLIYRNMLWSSTATTTWHVHVSLMCKYILRTSFIKQFLQTEHSQLPTNQLQ